jgi:very-short-patch-repair endonuclease
MSTMNYARFAEHPNDQEDYRRAKELRKAMPLAEQILWNALRVNTKKLKLRFRHQHPIHPYIVDFICIKLKLIIEVDGMSHDMRVEYDEKRDRFLKNAGYEVMHFTNEDVYDRCGGVIETIFERIKKLSAYAPPT